jgi:hypothetical protein
VCPSGRVAPRWITLLAAIAALPAAAQYAPTVDTLPVVSNQTVTLTGLRELHLTGPGDPLPGSILDFRSPSAWLFLDHIPPAAASALLSHLRVNGLPAIPDRNLRLTQYGSGAVIIPQGPAFPAMAVFTQPAFGGASMALQCYIPYNDASLAPLKMAIRSFRLQRGYMATLAQNENGSGISVNYVAQDRDVDVAALPDALSGSVRFIRIFPWRWVQKKGVAGDIWQKLNVGWYYNWNLNNSSTPDVEYVPIKQNRYWPGLNQDWKARGATELLGYNEPDRPDQANMSVDTAIAGWNDLLATGLRLGAPAVSDGGLSWLYDFIKKADAAHLRVDFVPVHYYRAYGDPADSAGAAMQLYNFLKEVHDHVKRPLWVTEFNNGANWTTAPKPTYGQERAAIASMIRMMDKTPFVERYAIYNWVEDVRNVQRADGSLTPAGQAYRDEPSPLSFIQPPGAAQTSFPPP